MYSMYDMYYMYNMYNLYVCVYVYVYQAELSRSELVLAELRKHREHTPFFKVGPACTCEEDP